MQTIFKEKGLERMLKSPDTTEAAKRVVSTAIHNKLKQDRLNNSKGRLNIAYHQHKLLESNIHDRKDHTKLLTKNITHTAEQIKVHHKELLKEQKELKLEKQHQFTKSL